MGANRYPGSPYRKGAGAAGKPQAFKRPKSPPPQPELGFVGPLPAPVAPPPTLPPMAGAAAAGGAAAGGTVLPLLATGGLLGVGLGLWVKEDIDRWKKSGSPNKHGKGYPDYVPGVSFYQDAPLDSVYPWYPIGPSVLWGFDLLCGPYEMCPAPWTTSWTGSGPHVCSTPCDIPTTTLEKSLNASVGLPWGWGGVSKWSKIST